MICVYVCTLEARFSLRRKEKKKKNRNEYAEHYKTVQSQNRIFLITCTSLLTKGPTFNMRHLHEDEINSFYQIIKCFLSQNIIHFEERYLIILPQMIEYN